MKFKGIVFDLDGTLVHTKPEYRYLVVGEILKEFGIEPVKEQIDKFWFQGNRNETIKKFFCLEPTVFWQKFLELDKPELRKDFIKFYEDNIVIRRLKQKGVKVGIVTGAERHIAELEIGLLDRELFDSIVFARTSEGSAPKPSPDALEKCIGEMGLLKYETVFVGNADEDIVAGKNAKIFSVFIDRKEHSFEFPEKPDWTISSLAELKQIL